jgi:hypothetical protein
VKHAPDLIASLIEACCNLRAGTLDNTTWAGLGGTFCALSAQSWGSPAADTVCHETQPSDVRTLAQAWRAQ